MLLYCVYDTLAQDSDILFEQPNDKAAIRSLQPLLKTPDVDFSTFELVCIGTYDKSTASITDTQRRLVCTLSDLVKPLVV